MRRCSVTRATRKVRSLLLFFKSKTTKQQYLPKGFSFIFLRISSVALNRVRIDSNHCQKKEEEERREERKEEEKKKEQEQEKKKKKEEERMQFELRFRATVL